MDEPRKTSPLLDYDLFLIELPEGDRVHYLITERILTVEPHQNAMDVPWSELADLFKGRTLRAVPMPGRRNDRPADAQRGVSTGPGPGVSTRVEVNLVKIGKGN